MHSGSLSTVALLVALTLISPTLVAKVASQRQDTGGNGVQDTMYDLEGSGEEQFLGSGDEYGSGSIEGSGSGDESTNERAPDCLRPLSGTYPEPADFESDLLPEIRCHLACIEHVS